jgi:hypothetical protein
MNGFPNLETIIKKYKMMCKILKYLLVPWDPKVTTIEESKDSRTLKYDELWVSHYKSVQW